MLGRNGSSTCNKYDSIPKEHNGIQHALVVQVGQLAASFANMQQGSLPSNTETNPTLQSGQQLIQDQVQNTDVESLKEIQKSNTEQYKKLRVIQGAIEE